MDIKQEGASWRDGAAFMHWKRVQRAVAACAAVAGAAVRAVNREGNTPAAFIQDAYAQIWRTKLGVAKLEAVRWQNHGFETGTLLATMLWPTTIMTCHMVWLTK